MHIIKTLNGLRGLAAIFVILSHFPQVGEGELSSYIRFFFYNSKLAYFGVDIFFVLSGFLITRNMLYALQKNKFSLKKFYIKRALRIFPIYYLTVFITYVFIDKTNIVSLLAYFSNFSFSISSFPHPLRNTWSLAVEEQFYLIWPFLVIYIFRKKTVNVGFKILFFVLFNIIFLYLFFDKEIAEGMVYRSTLVRLLTLGMGGVIAFNEVKIKNLNVQKWYTLLFFLIFYTSGALGRYNPLTVYIPSSVIKLFSFGICAVIFFIWVLKINEKSKSFLYKLFTSSFLTKTGLISYGLYLYHYPILYYFGLQPGAFSGHIDITKAFALFLLIIGLSVISYLIVEKPMLKLKDKLK